ncbi:MAG: bifunctional phosphopantothenoylcysteine decarboxylase/phosphopantothenate--cysteine ligase CoaBC [Acidobacteria bacterium]|nr:bifunctional phosphopantothenoylcysteine decarboxylase/phosphopantothenate--cysteine ligase CoaBC [Acidobacteriota bacterium]
MKVAVGISGGIAAYKAAEIVRELQQRGLDVQVIMTGNAQEFVRPLTFAALSGKKVITGMFVPEGGAAGQEPNIESAIEHIAVAQSIDLLLVAPATADILAKFSRGLADDFLTTTYLATKAPVVVVPAMNVNMWEHPATQENISRLRKRGVHIVEPESGYLACGMTGSGRLASNDAILSRVMDVLAAPLAAAPVQDLTGEVVLVTAGPTREAIDPVRYISNRSSGKMGYAIAQAAHARGARVLLVSGPTSLNAPEGVETIRITSLAEMRDAVLARWKEASIIIKAAAPADFRPRQQAEQKIHKSGQDLTLTLEPTEDILCEIGKQKGDRLLVGFAAETEDLMANAERKLQAKHLDMIIGNDVSGADTGLDSDFNSVIILGAGGLKRELSRLPKSQVAAEILNEVVHLRARSHARA